MNLYFDLFVDFLEQPRREKQTYHRESDPDTSKNQRKRKRSQKEEEDIDQTRYHIGVYNSNILPRRKRRKKIDKDQGQYNVELILKNVKSRKIYVYMRLYI